MVKPPLPFEPDPSQLRRMPLFSANKVPRYLFRIHTPTSSAETTTLSVVPSASKCGRAGRTHDIFSLSPSYAAALLKDHLWWDQAHEANCNLVSWTSSLLFALHYALHRHRGSCDTSALADIALLVLDTRGFPAGTFVSEMEILRVFAEHEKAVAVQNKTLRRLVEIREDPRRNRSYGEYLSQGELDIRGRCVQTTMQKLIDLGIFELVKELSEEDLWKKLALRVLDLREELLPSAPAPSATHFEVRKAITIADACFGDRWTIPVAAMLLALRRRKRNDAIIVQGVAAMFSREQVVPQRKHRGR
ncbi:hypothetical protein MMYC01_210142 [Madurella mycetomatis]|uniref:DUF7587 domain-containing protein n=1 Tax=Madurella mycetomatis TaxID=100816 RepID=A0A175VQF4_9PEZI|nr:hypothetical protein MMYC01_210142 [Madurella mycetomatis]